MSRIGQENVAEVTSIPVLDLHLKRLYVFLPALLSSTIMKNKHNQASPMEDEGHMEESQVIPAVPTGVIID